MSYPSKEHNNSDLLPRVIALTLILFSVQSCVEPFETTSIDFDRGVVIEAVLTNEMKQHEVLLSKVYSFEEDSVTTINDATVTIIDDLQNEYGFQEMEDGRYLSNMTFAAQKGMGYTLVINTRGGRTYRSTTEKFEEEAEVDNIYAERGPNAFGKDGISIYVGGSDKSGNAQYFRYTYEETYKIIAPKYLNLDFKLENYDPCEPINTYVFEVVPREEQQRVCFGYDESDEIVQASTLGSTANNITKFPVRFVPSDDFILSHRYSILVKQHVQSADAYSYYRTLNDFSSSESIFTDVQPGFLQSNIVATTEKDERILGYFEVASVSEKRLFFNYTDFFPTEALPDYPIDCNNNSFRPQIVESTICDSSSFPHCEDRSIYAYVDQGTVAYWNELNTNFGCDGGPYVVNPRGCGDCTLYGSNLMPDFWIE